MFTGTFQQTIDSKGRISVPVKFREVLNDPRIMITHFTMNGLNCLDVHPMAEWAKFAEQLGKQNPFDPNVIWFETFYIGAACECELDPQGRILVPPALRDEAGLKREIMLAGAIAKFRIFSREAWQEAKNNAKEKLMNDASELRRLSETMGRP
ncbi:MAG: division/cell wall cluster transcriptional repressor MraZ [Deltaproteobacteria bacterium]|nr:division/cell wall cluster transcriptional repressor MraZ [Deltaproteobacteria bacterium]MBM4296572.1 division/cell wall cluster transcriptional repressor MraZ [Deltaproteobacteria bacterium]